MSDGAGASDGTSKEVEEIWWEGEDMLVRTTDGQVTRYEKAYFTHIGRRFEGTGIIAQDCDVIYKRPFEDVE